MATLTVVNPFHNHLRQNRKLANLVLLHSFNPELLHAWERPASMAWCVAWGLFDRRSLTRQGGC